MFLIGLIVLLPRLILGFSVAHAIWGDRKLSSMLLKVFLGIPLGMGIVSILFFCAKWAALSRPIYMVIEIAAIFAALLLMLFIRKNPFQGIIFDIDSKLLKQSKYILMVLALAVIIWLAGFFITTILRPHGREDAWSNWNLLARFLFYSSDLSNTLQYIAASTFPGYPFMLSLDIASGWTFLNSVTTRIPILVAGLFSLSIPGLLFFGLSKTRGLQIAATATILVTGPWLAHYSSSLLSDVPMASYYLGACVLLSLYLEEATPELAALMGLVAGFTGWVKNDGFPFILIMSAVLFLAVLKRKNWIALPAFVLGMLLPVTAIFVYHKFLAAPSNIIGSGSEMLTRALDPSRFKIVLGFFLRQLYDFGTPGVGYALILLAVLLVGGIDLKNRNALVIASIFLMQYAAYFAVYMITPLPLVWHLGTSMPRVFAHIAPLLAFAVFSLLPQKNLFPVKNEAASAVIEKA